MEAIKAVAKHLVKIKCRSTYLTDLKDEIDLAKYAEIVNPIDYDFCLDVGQEYYLIGLTEVLVPRAYVVPVNGSFEIETQPLVLFDAQRIVLSDDFVMTLGRGSDNHRFIEFCIEPLSHIENWFWKYIEEEDDRVEECVQAFLRERGAMIGLFPTKERIGPQDFE